jgi:hypothetical protein
MPVSCAPMLPISPLALIAKLLESGGKRTASGGSHGECGRVRGFGHFGFGRHSLGQSEIQHLISLLCRTVNIEGSANCPLREPMDTLRSLARACTFVRPRQPIAVFTKRRRQCLCPRIRIEQPRAAC